MLRSTNPLNVLSLLCFLAYILLPLSRRNHEDGSDSGTSRDVEMRRLTAIPAEVASGLQFQSVFSVIITRSMRNMLIVVLPMMLAQTQGSSSSSSSSGDVERGAIIAMPPESSNGEGEIIAMPAESCNGQALSGGERTRGMDKEHSILLNPQSLGLKVLGIWIVPTLIGAMSYISQVVVANGHAKPKQKLLLHICSGVTVATCVPGVVLFIFCIIQWKKNPIRDLIIKWMIILGFGSAVVNIVGPVIAFGFFYW
ncbi:hypothetical protein Sjap_024513 [Stephania japonica]|uniref:Uncharacterized protein n=1 Tax=Stephania japonica TaxID=461633 RepID=A0AAP0HP15_9MAGN